MKCADLHVNVQDASGDRILAGDMLRRDPTSWSLWVDPTKVQRSGNKKDKRRREDLEEEDTHVGHVLGEVRKGRRKFKKSPKVRKGMEVDSCRIYGSLEGNKVQGDFHITARGHGYGGPGEHLSHEGTCDIFLSPLFYCSTFCTMSRCWTLVRIAYGLRPWLCR